MHNFYIKNKVLINKHDLYVPCHSHTASQKGLPIEKFSETLGIKSKEDSERKGNSTRVKEKMTMIFHRLSGRALLTGV